MVVREFEYTLKDGRKALIRSPQDEDIQGVLDYLYVSAGETDFILRYPEECGKYTPEGEKALFDRINGSDHEAMLICLVEGKVAGNCQIVWTQGMKTRHRATVAIALLKDAAFSGNDPHRGGKRAYPANGARFCGRKHPRQGFV